MQTLLSDRQFYCVIVDEDGAWINCHAWKSGQNRTIKSFQLYEPYEQDKLIFLFYFILKHRNVLILLLFFLLQPLLVFHIFFSSSSSIFVLVCETRIH